MKVVLVLLAISGAAFADGKPQGPGPCNDLAACEKACKAGKTKSCEWGGLLALESGISQDQRDHAFSLFDAGCKKNDGGSCWRAGLVVDPGEGAAIADRSKARGYYDRACKNKSARACMMLGKLVGGPGDDKALKAAAAAYKQAVAIFEQACKKQDAQACALAANLYSAGMGVTQDAKKADELRQRACVIKSGQPCAVPVKDHAVRPPPRPPKHADED